MGLCAVEMYQSVFGTMRTGGWETLRSEFQYFRENLPFTRIRPGGSRGPDGAFIGMGQTPGQSGNPSTPIGKSTPPPGQA